MRVDEHTIEVAGSPVYVRRAATTGTPVLYLHGVPTSSDDWLEALTLTGGIAPDLPGFGRSGKAGHLEYSIDGQAAFLKQLLDALELARVSVVAHNWGAAFGLALAAREPARVERLVLFNPLPLAAGFEWHRIARVWRMRAVGELAMGAIWRGLLARAFRAASATGAAWPDARVAAVWDQFDQGTQRATLRLHRATDDATIAAAAAESRALTQPALVIWGERDPWFTADQGARFAAQLPHATVERLVDAGHWPWLDRPELSARSAAFLAQGPVA